MGAKPVPDLLQESRIVTVGPQCGFLKATTLFLPDGEPVWCTRLFPEAFVNNSERLSFIVRRSRQRRGKQQADQNSEGKLAGRGVHRGCRKP